MLLALVLISYGYENSNEELKTKLATVKLDIQRNNRHDLLFKKYFLKSQ